MNEVIKKDLERSKDALSKTLNINSDDVKFVDSVYGGMSNRTYLLEACNKMYVSHIATDKYELFVDRITEKDALNTLGEKDFIQKEVYLSDEVRIFEYVNGSSMNHLDYKKHYKEISDTFHKLHDSNKLFKYNYNPFEYIYSMKNLLSTELDPLFYESLSLLEKNKELLENRKLYPCHNDLQPSNLIYDKKNKHITILDFEFAKNNDYLFDIASFGNLDFNDSINLIKIYNPNYTDEDMLVLKLWRIFINAQWYLIALKKKELGYDKELKMDFKEVGLFFLNHNRDIIDSI